MDDIKKPLVSVCCITYNHENYIRDTIEGFLLQKTNFPIEIIIHDDASTDKTALIVKDYAEKHPDLIDFIFQTINQYSQGIKPLTNFVFPRARGKYIALCEGDDYWTDPLKLQKQVDFLEGNPDCSLCFHASKHIEANNRDKYYIHRPEEILVDNKFEMKHAILGGGGFMATNSMLFLKEHIQERPDWMNIAPVGDLPLMLLLASKGKIGYIDEVMSVYRVMSNNSWSSKFSNDFIGRVKHYEKIFEMWIEFDKWSKSEHVVYTKKSRNKYKRKIRYNKFLVSITKYSFGKNVYFFFRRLKRYLSQ